MIISFEIAKIIYTHHKTPECENQDFAGSDTEIFTEVTVTSTTETEAFTEESTEITEGS